MVHFQNEISMYFGETAFYLFIIFCKWRQQNSNKKNYFLRVLSVHFRSRDGWEWETFLLLSPETKYSQHRWLLSYFLIIFFKSAFFFHVYLSVYIQYLPLMLSSSSLVKSPGGRLSPPLTLPPRGRSLRSVSFSCCLFAQCRRHFFKL